MSEKKLSLLDAIIAVAKNDSPQEWARYCELATKLVPGDLLPEEKARLLLARRLSQ